MQNLESPMIYRNRNHMPSTKPLTFTPQKPVRVSSSYRHYHDHEEHPYTGSFSVRFDITRQGHIEFLEMTFAFCSKDDNFSRKAARDLLDERFDKGQRFCVIYNPCLDYYTHILLMVANANKKGITFPMLDQQLKSLTPLSDMMIVDRNCFI